MRSRRMDTLRRLAAPGLAAVVGVVAAAVLLPPLEATFAALFAILAVVVATSDIAIFEIPDWASAALFVLGLAHALAGPAAAGDLSAALPATLDALARAAAAGGTLLAVALAYRAGRRRDGLGFGDVKLAAALGPWLAWPDLPMALLVAVAAALIAVAVRAAFAGRAALAELAVPLGAFLAPAAFLVFLLREAGLPISVYG